MLPQLSVPTYTTKLFSLPKPVSYRPYLVGEEKLLLTAQQTGDSVEIEQAVIDVLNRCTFGKLQIESLPFFDVEYLYLQLRAASVDNVLHLSFDCHNTVVDSNHVDGMCHTKVGIDVNLNDVVISVAENHTEKIALTPEMTIVMQYPTVRQYAKYTMNDTIDTSLAIRDCLYAIATLDGTMHYMKDQTEEEITTFMDSLTLRQMEQLQEFFETMPSVSHTCKFICPSCHYTEDVVIRGLHDFFD